MRPSLTEYRNRFLRAVSRKTPEAVQGLDRLRPAFGKAAATPFCESLRAWHYLNGLGSDWVWSVPEVLALRRELEGWAGRFHLEADWCLDAALRLLASKATPETFDKAKRAKQKLLEAFDAVYNRYGNPEPSFSDLKGLGSEGARLRALIKALAAEYPKTEQGQSVLDALLAATVHGWRQKHNLVQPLEYGFLPSPQATRNRAEFGTDFKFWCRGWLPTDGISPDDYQKAIRKGFRKALADYMAQATAAEDRPSPAKRGELDRHFEWLALFQCGGFSYVQILHRIPNARDESTIRRAVQRTAKLIGLRLRRT